MGAPPVLFCVGATKAGTTWLYRTLRGHPGCALKAVKEFHYWDSFDAKARDWQGAALRRQLGELEEKARRARRAGDVARMERLAERRSATAALLTVLEGDRSGDAAYRAFLTDGGEGRLVADITPSYASLPAEGLQRLCDAFPEARFVYLLRDPVARLWSHARMMAQRGANGPEEIEGRANRILRQALDSDPSRPILGRGDYRAALERLRPRVPEGRLRVEYCERLFTDEGWGALQDFLGLDRHPAYQGVAHEGVKARLRDDLRHRAVEVLRPYYDWAARAVGPLPAEWQATLERAHA